MDTSKPVVRFLHFVLLGRRLGLDGHWPSSFIYDHEDDDRAKRARAVFDELTGLRYMDCNPKKIGPNSLPGRRYTVTRAGKEYFISLDDPKHHQPSPFTTWAK